MIEIKTPMLRGPCDDYCPLVSHVCCGLPEASDVYNAAQRRLFWACHSNNLVPCVATDYNQFPEGATVITTSADFTKLTGYLC